MTTQYTPILKLALPVQGELSGTWGDVVNDNITSMVEQAIAGLSVVNTWTTNSHVLTTANGVTAESRAAMLSLTDSGTALTGAGSVICPALSKVYIVKNGTAQVITVKTAAGSGIAVPVGKTMLVYCDGTNVLEAVDHVVTLSAGTLTITGLTTFASLKGTGAVTVTNILDEDNMASDSATALATQQSIKAYVDSQVGTVDTLSEILAIGNTSGANNLIIDNGQAITTNTINETTAASGVTIDSVLLKDDGVNATNLEITNLKANDGTSAGSIADSTGIVTLASLVATTADINAGTIDNTVIGGTTAAAGSFTTGSFSETTFVGLTARPAGVPATAGRLWAAQDETGNYGIASKASTTDSFTYIGNTGTKATLGQSYGSTGSYLPLVLQTSDLDRLTISAAGAATFSSTVAGAFNGTLGATTPASVAATTGTFSGAVDVTGTATFSSALSVENIATFTNDNQYLVFNRPTTGDFAYIGTASNTTGGPATDLGIRAENNLLLGAGGYGADLTIASTGAATFSGSVALAGSSAGLLLNDSATADNTIQLNTTGGTTFVGANGSAGNRFIGSSAYASTFGTTQANALELATANTVRMTISSTGAATFGGKAGFNSAVADFAVTARDDTATSIPLVLQSATMGTAGNEVGMRFGFTGTSYQKVAIIAKSLNSNAVSDLHFCMNNVASSANATIADSKMTLDASGNLGIGTSSPAYKIDSRVSTSASIVAGLNLDASGNSNGDGSAINFSRVDNILPSVAKISAVKAEVSNNETDLVFSNYAAGSLTEKMRIIGASGNVGINTSSPSTKLTVDAAATISATDYYVASTWTAALRGSGVNSKAGLLLNSYSASGQSALASIHSEPVADYRAALVATYSADGSGAGYFAVNQFRPAYSDTQERMRIDSSGGLITNPAAGGHAVFNEGGVDADFRVESDGNANMLFVDGGSNRVGIGRVPQDNGSTLQVAADATASTDLQLVLRGLSNENKKLVLGFDTTANIASITSLEAGVDYRPLHLQGSEFVWNEVGSNHDFRVESDSNTHALFVDAGNSYVNLNSSATPDSSVAGFMFTADQLYTSAGAATTLNYQVRFYNGNGLVGAITTDGSATAYLTSSDQRLKENIADAPDAGDLIDAIQVRQFDWKADGEHQRYGMVAQELNAVAPEAVSAPEDPDEMMGVDYSKLVPMMLKEIQSLRARISQLEGAK
jgi:hypothetical protein